MVVATALRARGSAAWVEHATMRPAALPSQELVLVPISASGRTPEVVATAARHRGTSHVVAVTNDPGSPLAKAADVVVPLHAGIERAGISCRSYRATIAALALLTGAVTIDDLRAFSQSVAAPSMAVASMADMLDGAGAIDVLAEAPMLGLAEQVALMLREGPRLPATAYETGDWLHTGVYLALPGHRALMFAGAAADAEVIDTIRRRGGEVVTIDAGAAQPPDGAPSAQADARDPIRRSLIGSIVAERLAAALWRRVAATDVSGSDATIEASAAAVGRATDRARQTPTTTVGSQTRSRATVDDIRFTAGGIDVEAYLVRPGVAGTRAVPGILWWHWLDDKAPDGDRTEFLDEATGWATERGVASILPQGTYPWRVSPSGATADAREIRAEVGRFRAALDVLVAEGGVDPDRIAVVGHDFGAMIAMLGLRADDRGRGLVSIAATPRWGDWMLAFWDLPDARIDYLREMLALDPIEAIAELAPRPILLQHGERDFYVARMAGFGLQRAAGDTAELRMYDAEHDLKVYAARDDRTRFLERILGL
jgi:fructoselysine-6-P-deglycase FrlB-like protein/predicted esterase